jgi:hypothetical protein
MKKFAGNKPLAEILKQCKDQGVHVNDFMFKKHGWDTIVLGDPKIKSGYVIYNTFNGTFWGKTDKGVEFDSSSSAKHDKEPWMQALLSFFYVEKGQPGAAPRKPTMVDYTLGSVL